jgi:hypothetical protein
MATIFVLLLVGGFIALLRSAKRQRQRRLEAAATVRFVVDATGVERDLADGREEAVTWDELQEVKLIVLPKGPWGERVRFVLDGGGLRGCIVPLDVAEQGGLLGRLGALPGFDHRGLAEGLADEQTGSRVLWSRSPSS